MSNKKVEPMCYFYNEREKGGKSREDWMVGERERGEGREMEGRTGESVQSRKG